VGSDRIPSQSHLVVLFCAVAVIAGFYVAAASPQFRFWEGASAIKLLHARALLAGQGYTDIGRIGSPPEIVRPPGFDLLLAGIIALFGEDMLALKLINNSFAPLAGFALWLLFRRRTQQPDLAALLALAATLFPHLYQLARYLESEILFLLLLTAALCLFERAHDQGFRDRRLLAAFTMVLAVACLVRTVALVLVPAAWMTLALRRELPRRRRLSWAAIIFAGWLAVGGGWMLRNQLVAPKGELTYLTKFLAGAPVNSLYWLAEDHRVPLLPPPPRAGVAAVAARSIPNGAFFLRQLLENVWPASADWPPGVVLAGSALPALLVMLGLVRGLLRRRRLLDFFTALYLGVITFWPYQDNRFLLPVTPFLLLYLIEALEAAGRACFRPPSDQEPRIVRGLLVFLLALLIPLFAVQDLHYLAQGKRLTMPVLERSPHFRITSPNLGAYHSLLLLDWLRSHSRPSDRILFHSYEPCALLTERQCSPIPPVNPESLLRFLDDKGITLVVVDDQAEYPPAALATFTSRFLIPAIEAHPERFQVLYRLPSSSAQVLRVVRE